MFTTGYFAEGGDVVNPTKIKFVEQSTTPTAESGKLIMWVNSSNELYIIDESGNTINLSASSNSLAENSFFVGDNSNSPQAKTIEEVKTLLDVVSQSTINTTVSTAIDNLVDGAPNALNTLNELADALNDDANAMATITTALGTKVDKVSGKDLSQNDFTDTLKGQYDSSYTHSQSAHAPSNATNNDTDSNLKNRANHTGEQAISTITNLQSTLDAKLVKASNLSDLESASTSRANLGVDEAKEVKLKFENNSIDTEADGSFSQDALNPFYSWHTSVPNSGNGTGGISLYRYDASYPRRFQWLIDKDTKEAFYRVKVDSSAWVTRQYGIIESLNSKMVAQIDFKIERGSGANITLEPKGINDLTIAGTDASFDNSNGVIRLDGNYAFTSSQATITDAWGFYFKNLYVDSSGGTWLRLINCSNQTTGVVIALDGSNSIAFSAPTTVGDRRHLDSSDTPEDQAYDLYVDIKNSKAYVNGVEVNVSNNSSSITHRSNTQVFCKNNSGGTGIESTFIGTCEQVLIFNDSVTESEAKFITDKKVF